MSLNPKDHPVESRLLVRDPYVYDSTPIEVDILEWAPSGDFVKLRYCSGSASPWRYANQFNCVEMLVNGDALREQRRKFDAIVADFQRKHREAMAEIERKVYGLPRTALTGDGREAEI